MDSFSHALAGSLVADLFPATRKMGPRAQVIAVVAGMAPDLDMLPAFIANFPPERIGFFGLFNKELVAAYHRAYTHSFFFTALAAILLAWPCRRIAGGKGALWQWASLLWLVFLSHILLDYLNPWGVRVWLPFRWESVATGLMPLLDPLFTGLMAVLFVVNHVLREPFQKPGDPPLKPYWREKTSAWLLSRFPGVAAAAWIAVALLTIRVMLTVYGILPRPELLS